MANNDAVGILKSLKNKGVRFTPQRQAILEFLLSTNTHPTAEEIYKQVRVKFPAVSLGTVYNTLNMLKEHNYLMELSCGDISARFDGNADNHYHIMCDKCGKVVDYFTDLLDIEEMAAADTGFTINTHRLILYGVCADCQELH